MRIPPPQHATPLNLLYEYWGRGIFMGGGGGLGIFQWDLLFSSAYKCANKPVYPPSKFTSFHIQEYQKRGRGEGTWKYKQNPFAGECHNLRRGLLWIRTHFNY